MIFYSASRFLALFYFALCLRYSFLNNQKLKPDPDFSLVQSFLIQVINDAIEIIGKKDKNYDLKQYILSKSPANSLKSGLSLICKISDCFYISVILSSRHNAYLFFISRFPKDPIQHISHPSLPSPLLLLLIFPFFSSFSRIFLSSFPFFIRSSLQLDSRFVVPPLSSCLPHMAPRAEASRKADDVVEEEEEEALQKF